MLNNIKNKIKLRRLGKKCLSLQRFQNKNTLIFMISVMDISVIINVPR